VRRHPITSRMRREHCGILGSLGFYGYDTHRWQSTVGVLASSFLESKDVGDLGFAK